MLNRSLFHLFEDFCAYWLLAMRMRPKHCARPAEAKSNRLANTREEPDAAHRHDHATSCKSACGFSLDECQRACAQCDRASIRDPGRKEIR
jgi:hypothetical protein